MAYNWNPYAPYNGPVPDQLQQYRMNQIQMQQPVQQPIAPQQTAQDERIYVQGRGAAEAYLVAPGAFVRLWDVNENIFYEKRADQTGRPYMETFEYKRCDNANPIINYEEKIKALEERIAALEGGRRHESNANNTGVQPVQEDVHRRSTARG